MRLLAVPRPSLKYRAPIQSTFPLIAIAVVQGGHFMADHRGTRNRFDDSLPS